MKKTSNKLIPLSGIFFQNLITLLHKEKETRDILESVKDLNKASKYDNYIPTPKTLRTTCNVLLKRSMGKTEADKVNLKMFSKLVKFIESIPIPDKTPAAKNEKKFKTQTKPVKSKKPNPKKTKSAPKSKKKTKSRKIK